MEYEAMRKEAYIYFHDCVPRWLARFIVKRMIHSLKVEVWIRQGSGMAYEVKRLFLKADDPTDMWMVISMADAALLQAVVDAGRSDSAPDMYRALAALDARLAEKERK